MKKAGIITAALGTAVLIFAIVCFISAGSLLNEIEPYIELYMEMFGGYIDAGDIDAGDIIDMAQASGFDAGGFQVFAYNARVWLLVGGLALLAAGIALAVIGSKKTYGVQVGSAYDGYDRYDDYDDVNRPAGREETDSAACPVCGAPCDAGAAFCRSCGAALSAPKPSGKVCAACGAENEAEAIFCCECGQRLEGEASEEAHAAADTNSREDFRPEREADVAAEAEYASDMAGKTWAATAEATDEAVEAQAEAAEATDEEAAEPASVFRKSASFSAVSGDDKPVVDNPFLHKAGDL